VHITSEFGLLDPKPGVISQGCGENA